MASPDEIRAGGASIEFRADRSKLEKDLAEGGPILDTLKSAFGRGSTFKELTEIAVGGGVVAGLTVAGQQLSALTGKAVQLSDAFREGRITAGEMTESLARSIPILGGFWEAGRNIRELMTGEEAIARNLLRIDTERLAILQQQGQILKDARSRRDALPSKMADFNDRLAVDRLSPEDKPFGQAAADYNRAAREADRYWKAQIAKARPEDKTRLEEIKQQEVTQLLTQYKQTVDYLNEKQEIDGITLRLKEKHNESLKRADEQQRQENERNRETERSMQDRKQAEERYVKSRLDAAESIREAIDPERRLHKEIEAADSLVESFVLTRDERDRYVRQLVGNLGKSMSPDQSRSSSMGTVNPFAMQSLQALSPLIELNQNVRYITQKLRNGEAGLSFN